MVEIKNLNAKTSQVFIKEYFVSDCVLLTEENTIFFDLNYCIEVHVREISETKESDFNLK